MAGDLITFGAIVRYGAGVRKPLEVPQRVEDPTAAVVVANPWTGQDMWLPKGAVVNVVNGVATVSFTAPQSFRKATAKLRGFREYINPFTGNTFRVALASITKENP
ncbi:hypothetical protein SEA_KENZERS_66 [Microbacterium phage Kenzers]|uniref:hypothetical protein n=1 Tax=Microbacterium phage Kenzers TaxID=2927243 RepID=UPI0021FE4C13|nr:hypothetical protein QDW39_gp66 [Microbacterium phage Kenzers]UVT31695.1 hypothetical protein SEA_KENZERS_66 [Microbacterium phage Kenzers]